MRSGGDKGWGRRGVAVVVALTLAGGASGCGGGDAGSGGSRAAGADVDRTAEASKVRAPDPADPLDGTVPFDDPDPGSSTTVDGGSPGTTVVDVTTATSAPRSDDTDPGEVSRPVEADSLQGFAAGPRSAPADGSGMALLRSVRVGHHGGYDRIVFEFAGPTRPGYRIRWADGPVLADGSGKAIAVAGEGQLEVVLQPASGVDMATGKPVYTGPDRIAITPGGGSVVDLVRTGDFEAVLTWVAGVDEARPYRVTSLAGPTRLVVDVRAR